MKKNILIIAGIAVIALILVWSNRTQAPTVEYAQTPTVGTTTESVKTEAANPAAVPAKNTRHAVGYTADGFTPDTLTIKRGDTVVFANETDMPMWVASAIHPTHEVYPGFDQKVSVGKGGIYEFTFEKSGTWKYHNHASAGRRGTIIVE